MQNMPIGIFRGDDTDAFSYQTIVGTIKTDLDLTGCKAVFRYLGFSVEFDPIPEDKKLTIVIPADETKKFPPGLGYASLRVYDSEGRLKTFSNRIMVFVATKTPMFGSDEFEVDFNVRATLEPLKFFVGPNPDDFDEYRGYVEKVIDRASATKYGLAILLDAINSDLGAADGVAATPVAVKAAYAAIIDKLTDDYYTAEQTDEAIDRVAAYYITYNAAGNPFPTRAALLSAQTVYSGGKVRTPTRNDYCVVLADETHDNAEYRYIYAVADGETTGSWQPQFPVGGVMTVDQSVTKDSQNPVSGGGVWSAIWGTASTAFSSLYDWAVAQLGLKRDYTDLSYDTTETVEVPALHSVMTVGGQTLAEYDLLCTEEVPDPPQIGHTYTWRADGAAFYVTQGVSALQTTWILYSQNGESLDGVTTQNATQGFYPDLDFRPSGAVVTIHKTTAQKTVTVEDELALKSDIPTPSTATPAMDGTGAAGTSAAFARGDHVHPTDTSRVPTSRTVNGKALSSDVTLDADDVGAYPATDAEEGEYESDKNLYVNGRTRGEHVQARSPSNYADWCDVATLLHIADEFDPQEQYAKDALVTFRENENWKLYKCIAVNGHTGNWNSNDFTEATVEDILAALRTALAGKANTSDLLAKLDSTSAAPAFSTSSTYAVGEHVTYNGGLYRCTTAVTTAGAWTGSTNWTADTMTDPDAVLNITSQNQLRVVAKDGTILWAQDYDLASTSSATLACDATNNFTFADGATTQAFSLPTAPTGKVGDFGLDIDNSANKGAATMTLTGLDTTFSVVVPKGESLNDMLAIAAGELARFYVTLTTFRVNNLPTWHIVKQVVENGGAQS